MEPVLDRLACKAGILPEYTDKMGQRHVTDVETQRRFLGAMGLPAETDAQAGQTLDALTDSEWRRHCPPVRVVRASALPVRTRLCLPEGCCTELGLRLEEENGAHHAISLKLAAAPVVEERRIDGVLWRAYDLPLPFTPGTGYHRIQFDLSGTPASMAFIVTPERCYLPEFLSDDPPGRVWGIPCQLYALRSGRNWGIGDFTDLQQVLAEAARAGASLVGLNPLCALFPEDPENAGPYCSSSRLFINPLYVDIEAVPEFAESADAQALYASVDFQAGLYAVRQAEWIDYARVSGLKYRVFEKMFAHFRAAHLDPLQGVTGRGQAFGVFCEQGGAPLRQLATYQALSGMMGRGGPAPGWRAWPEPWRDSRSAAVLSLSHDARVQFFMYLQWLAEEQLAAAADVGRKSGLKIGLYPDQTVGVADQGAETWSDPELFVSGSYSIGVPPDLRRPLGQNWGLAPMIPHRIRETAHRNFRAMLQVNMRHAGALRIDHVMGLMRQFWAPLARPGEKGLVRGAYVAYDFDDLLGILALESQRHKCIVLGEDMGTVPPGFHDKLVETGILSTRVLYRQCAEDGAFFPARNYLPFANVSIGNHDQPTLIGWWREDDITLFVRHGLFATGDGEGKARARRLRDRERLIALFDAEGVWPDGQPFADRVTGAQLSGAEIPDGLLEAAVAFLAKTPSAVVLLQLEDVFGQAEQVNLPGTVREYPNWRRRLPVALEELGGHARFAALSAILREARP